MMHAAAVAALCLGGSASAGVDVSFSARPTAVRDGAGAMIAFAVAAPTDVEVTVVDATNSVVRHLAAGVLGARNPPPGPLKPGLAQTLGWDGKDDFGRAALDARPALPLRVRVRAGTGVKFGRCLGENPCVYGTVNSIACDEDGNLYVMASNSQSLGPGTDTLRVFSPEGRYLRTIIPFPADLPPEAAAAAATWDAAGKRFRPINRVSGNPAFYPWRGGACIASVSKNGGIVLTAGTTVYRVDLNGGNVKGEAMWPKGAGLKNPGWNIPQLAATADGNCIYYSNVANTPYAANVHPSKLDPKWPQGRVYRRETARAGEDPTPFFDLALPDYDKQPYWLPDAWNKRTAAYGICVDASSHLYVCDLVNQEIVEVDPDGKRISTTKVRWPERVAVDAATGDYYVVSRLDRPKDGFVGKKLLKVVGRGEGAKVAAELPLKGAQGECMALGKVGGKPVIWLAGGADGVVCIRDSGAAFEVIETGFKGVPGGEANFCRLAVDYARDEVYANDGGAGLWRYDGVTGKGERLRNGPDVAVGCGGMLYYRTGDGYAGPMERLTRELKPAPFPSGTHVLHPDVYSRAGIGFCEKGLGVGPRGESYVNYMYGWNKYFVAGFDPDGKPIDGKYLKGKIPAKPGDKAKGVPAMPDSAVLGPVPAESGGLRVDRQGNIYLGMRGLPKGFAPPAGLEKDMAYLSWSGVIAKFPPSGGTVLGAVPGDNPPNAEGPRTEIGGGRILVGATAVYAGTGPFSGGGWGTGSSDCCVCRVPRFDVDPYGRLVFPNAVANSITFMDNAGNVVLEFGAYGNFDSQYVNPNTDAGKAGKPTVAGPEFPLAWPLGAGITARSIYALDLYNRRIVRADLTWQAEETCEVR